MKEIQNSWSHLRLSGNSVYSVIVCITQQIHPCLQVVPGGQFMADYPMSLGTYFAAIPISTIKWGLVVGLSVLSSSEFNSWTRMSSSDSRSCSHCLKTPSNSVSCECVYMSPELCQWSSLATKKQKKMTSCEHLLSLSDLWYFWHACNNYVTHRPWYEQKDSRFHFRQQMSCHLSHTVVLHFPNNKNNKGFTAKSTKVSSHWAL